MRLVISNRAPKRKRKLKMGGDRPNSNRRDRDVLLAACDYGIHVSTQHRALVQNSPVLATADFTGRTKDEKSPRARRDVDRSVRMALAGELDERSMRAAKSGAPSLCTK